MLAITKSKQWECFMEPVLTTIGALASAGLAIWGIGLRITKMIRATKRQEAEEDRKDEEATNPPPEYFREQAAHKKADEAAAGAAAKARK
jgi:hypothetical protein